MNVYFVVLKFADFVDSFKLKWWRVEKVTVHLTNAFLYALLVT